MKKQKFKDFQISQLDVSIAGLTILLLLLSFVYIGFYYKELPEIIGVHFNGKGEADGFGDKITIWFIPVLFTVLSFAMLYASKDPLSLDFSGKIKTQKLLEAGSKTLIYSGLLLAILNVIITYTTVQASLPNSKESAWLMYLSLLVTLIFVIIVFIIDYKAKR